MLTLLRNLVSNGHGKCAALKNETCGVGFPLPGPPPLRRAKREGRSRDRGSLGEFHVNRTSSCLLKTAGAILWILFAFLPTACCAESLRVIVLLSDNTSPYQSFASKLSIRLPASIQVTVQEQPEKPPTESQADLIVAVGVKAAQMATKQTRLPVLVAMVPKAGYEEVQAQLSEKNRFTAISVIYLDQPFSRQLDFIQAILPDRHRIGVLYTPNNVINVNYMRRQASDRGVKLIAKPVMSPDKLFSALDDLLENSDVLLALPDNTIYNSITIRNILLSTFRSGIPFIGMSQSFVTAGALGAVFSTQEQISDQIAATILSFASSKELPEPQYSREFSILLNNEVARSLGLELQSTDVIRRRMNSLGKEAP